MVNVVGSEYVGNKQAEKKQRYDARMSNECGRATSLTVTIDAVFQVYYTNSSTF